MFLTHSKSLGGSNKKMFSNVPSLPNGKGNHLGGSRKANKLVIQTPNTSKYLSKYSNNNSAHQNVKLNISHSCSIEKGNGKHIFNVELKAVTPIVKPSNFICVLDVSGSMSDSSSYRNDPEASKFSKMDLVKHSVNTIRHCLRPEDKLSIITFSHGANEVLALTHMNEDGKLLATRTLNMIHEGGSTNLWSGLLLSMNELGKLGIQDEYNNFIILLTDGEPTDNPPRGIYNEFLSNVTKSPLFCNLHTIGYGYGLDSTLLFNLAKSGNGLFAHIPDFSMCNTVFINLLSNCLATAITNVNMKFKSISGIQNTLTIPDYVLNGMIPPNQTQSNQISLGPIQSEQPRNFIFEAQIEDFNKFKFDLEFEYGNKIVNYTINTANTFTGSKNSKEIIDLSSNTFKQKEWADQVNEIFSSSDTVYQVFKTLLCDIINRGLQSSGNNASLKKTCEELDNLCDWIGQIKNIANSQANKNKLDALLLNIKSPEANYGQIHKAFSNEEWFNRWGIHYLKYFVRSHELQICSNFKDTSLQLYGGTLFKELRTEIEDIFSSIPIPQPSRSSTPFTGNFQQTFYTASGPCFDGNGRVKMATCPDVLVKNLKKGDMILNSDGDVAMVVCIIKTIVKHGNLPMVLINGLRVTPYHPIKHNGKWVHPCTIKEPTVVHCDTIYNFVLDKHHIITINNTDAITLGHNVTDDSVLAHPFFGSQRVIENLKSNSGWENGLIVIDDYTPKFDENGLIASFF